MPAVDVDDGELMVTDVCGARVTAMPKMTDVSERMKRGPVEKPIFPALGMVSVSALGQKHEHTSRRCSGNTLCDLRVHSLQ